MSTESTHEIGRKVAPKRATAKRLLLDLSVFLDVILDRPPDADAAAALWAAIERGLGHGMVPAHGVTTIFYLLEKAHDAAFAREGVERLKSI